jgi:hypothetical protein
MGKKVFTLKTFGAKLYTWSPSEDIGSQIKRAKKPYYCDASPNSQGQDWVTTYVYNIAVVNGEQQRIAYVECDYVE